MDASYRTHRIGTRAPAPRLIVAVLIGILVIGGAGMVLLDGTETDLTTFQSSTEAQEYSDSAGGVRLGASEFGVDGGNLTVMADSSGRLLSQQRDRIPQRTVDPMTARESGWTGTFGMEGDIAFVSHRSSNESEIAVIDTTPADAARRIGSVKGIEGAKQDQQFALGDDVLIAAGDGKIRVYDIRDPRHPESMWQRQLEGAIEAVQVREDSLSIALTRDVGERSFCPVRPFQGYDIPCSDVYHDRANVSIDQVTALLGMDVNGTVHRSFAFAGPDTSHVFFKGETSYITYSSGAQVEAVLNDFLESAGAGSNNQGPRVSRSSFFPVHGGGHSGTELQRPAYSASYPGMETALERFNSRVRREARTDDTGVRHQFTEWMDKELRSYIETGIVKLDDDFTIEGRVEVPGSVPRRELMAFTGETITVGTHVDDPFGNGTDIDLYRVGPDLSVGRSLQKIATGKILAESVRVRDGRGYVRIVGPETRTNVVDLRDDDIARYAVLNISGRGYIEPLADRQALKIVQAEEEMNATLLDLSGPAPDVVDTTGFGTELVWEEGRPPTKVPASFGDRVIVTGITGNYVVSVTGSVRTVDLPGEPVIDTVYREPYLYLTGRDGVRIVEDRAGRMKEVKKLAMGVGRNGHIALSGSGLVGPTSSDERFMRVLNIDASPAEVDFGLEGQGFWHPENRTKIYRKLQQMNKTQYLIEVSGDSEGRHYPDVDPTADQLDAAWHLYNETYENAREKGWFNITAGLEDGFRDVNNDRHYQKPAYAADGRVLDPSRPEVLMYYYDSQTDQQVLVGVMYLTNNVYDSSTEIEDGAGPLTYWHYHQYDSLVCYWEGIIPVDDMGLSWSGQRCPHLASTRSPEMMHVWFIDHPDGQFAHRMGLPAEIIEPPSKMSEERFKAKMGGD